MKHHVPVALVLILVGFFATMVIPERSLLIIENMALIVIAYMTGVWVEKEIISKIRRKRREVRTTRQ